MTLFSNSRGLERMMQQKPIGQQPAETPDLPPEHPCFGCGSGRDRRCVGICYKELLNEQKRRNCG